MKSKKLHILFSVMMAAGLGATAQKSAGQVVLDKGQKFQIENVTKVTSNVEMMGQSMEITNDATTVREIEVKAKNPASYNITSTITKMKTNSSMMGQEMKYDSEVKADQDTEIGKVVGKQVNKAKEAELDFNGKLINVKKDSSDNDGNPMAAMMSSMGNSDAIIGTAELVQVLPVGKKVGDVWTDSTSADGIKTVTTYTYKDQKGKDATIGFAAVQTTNKVTETQGMEITVTMESKIAGESTVDINTGLISKRTMTMDGTGNLDMMGQAAPMSTKMSSTSTVKAL